ncbi:cyclic pyranopterin monophosphate synthase MoaC [Halobacteria archaeon AArc-m2/3/4]|uniref:Probable cyclic pyranopterin monophosphate synthase n=1 Tax=Natronoglomus mannanivorans TaxID=2979990 RepID=A0AAP3E023_9EURY|nr:cyclic pyranopterin monophosphate synthase MoaC [Halobacteria archaeon AArc-xg1-1]MCU4975578.1 cyclic pyranopterin monophosphate synthase MoaC [Halobacteria archaeon AArc-m2/3/4]
MTDQNDSSSASREGGTREESASDSSDDARAGADDLTHTTTEGDVQMVDVGEKPDSERRAVAAGEIRLRPETVAAIRDDEVGKGDVLATARIGAIQAVKHTWETIPMCHQIPITNVDTDFALAEDRIECEVAVETTGKTGCEMEALEGVTTGLNVVWDMVKAIEKDDAGGYPATRIENVRVLEKRKERVERTEESDPST